MIFSKFITVATFVVGLSQGACPATWNYDQDGADWPTDDLEDQCDGTKQSPINIQNDDIASKIDKSTGVEGMSTISITVEDSDVEWEAKNNGHTLVLDPSTQGAMRMTGGILPSDTPYCFYSFHLHWGHDEDTAGTEHVVEGEASALDMHFIFYDCSADDVFDAATESGNYDTAENGYRLAVVNVLFKLAEEGEEGNALVDELADVVYNITEADTSVDGLTIDFASVIAGTSSDYWSYLGSLTTPPCNEVIRWHVLKQQLVVTAEQVDTFRMLMDCDDELITKNYRVPVTNTNPVWAMCGEYSSDSDPCTVYEDDGSGAHPLATFVALALSMLVVLF